MYPLTLRDEFVTGTVSVDGGRHISDMDATSIEIRGRVIPHGLPTLKTLSNEIQEVKRVRITIQKIKNGFSGRIFR